MVLEKVRSNVRLIKIMSVIAGKKSGPVSNFPSDVSSSTKGFGLWSFLIQLCFNDKNMCTVNFDKKVIELKESYNWIFMEAIRFCVDNQE